MEEYQLLEKEWAAWAGVQNVVACSSGTAALHLALEALRLPPGSQVIVPDFSMIACARAVVLAGLTPVFADCNERLLLDVSKLEPLVTERTKAIMAVHIYGRVCDMEAIHAVAGRHQLRVVEDLAEAHGVPPHPATDAACWSFYKNKIIAGEEGGAVAFRPGLEKVGEIATSLRSLGFTEQHDFIHRPRGHNYRLANALAALVRKSITEYSMNLARRRSIEAAYEEHCAPAFRLPTRSAPWVYDLRVPGLTTGQQNFVVKLLNTHGVAARHAFKPMRLQPEFINSQPVLRTKMKHRTMFSPRVQETPENTAALKAGQEVIYLPLYPTLLDNPRFAEQARAIFEVINSVLA